jgi:ketosteroid isomerase-like protein
MRKTRFLSLGLLFVILFSFAVGQRLFAGASDTREADRLAITKVFTEQEVAWNRGDIDAFVQGYWHSPEITFAGSSGITRGWDGLLARYKKNYPDRATMGTLALSDLEIRFVGPDAAFILGGWHLKREKGDIGGVASLVVQRFPEGWRIVHDHTSVVAETK